MERIRQTSACNVVYHTLGETDRSAMPMGNGDLCASVWLDARGALHFYAAKSDALTETDRNVKLGMVTLTLEPNPFTGEDFRQTLDLANGLLTVEGGGCSLELFVAREADVIYLTGSLSSPRTVRAEVFDWRVEPGPWREATDRLSAEAGGVCFRHQNGETEIAETARVQAVDDLTLLPDLLSGRVFGGCMTLCTDLGDVRLFQRDASRLGLEGRAERSFECRLAAASGQMDESAFLRQVTRAAAEAVPAREAKRAVSAWWNAYWEKSYVFVSGDRPASAAVTDEVRALRRETDEYSCACPSAVTRAYTLTKYMTACCENGKLPIYYNGMLFNLCPGAGTHLGIDNFRTGYSAQPAEITPEVNPDERSWAVETLWQNVRLPYYAMPARGEAASMRPLFDYYQRFWALNRYRAAKYYHAEGQHNTEMTYTFGLQSVGIYGEDRGNRPLGYADNRWGGAVDVSPGLELACLMLDWYAFTRDGDFLRQDALPYAEELLRYIETRFPLRENGRIVVGPLQSVETYWDTIDPVPVTSGMRALVERVLALPPEQVEHWDWFLDYQERLPQVAEAVEDGERVLLPARAHDGVRHNVELPELYTVFPFRLYGLGKPDLGVAARTFEKRAAQFGQMQPYTLGVNPGAPSFSGWQYEGPAAALLGLTDTAKRILVENCALQNPGTRFPAMWGPIYDAVPDADHGANILNTLQLMLMQTDGRTIRLLPSFPADWDVEFRLWADSETAVECVYRGGTLCSWKTEPAEAADRVVLP